MEELIMRPAGTVQPRPPKPKERASKIRPALASASGVATTSDIPQAVERLGEQGMSAAALLALMRRRVFTPITVLFFFLALFFAVGPDLPDWIVFAPLALSVVVFGLPHGALDHLVPARLAGRRAGIASISVVACLYVVLGAGVLVVWNVASPVAFGAFIALTWFHWGQGDLWVDIAAHHSGRSRGLILQAGTVIVRGGIPLLLPLLFHPEVYERVRLGTVELFAGPAAAADSWVLGPGERLGVGLAFGFVVCGMAMATWMAARAHGHRAAWVQDQAEIAVLGLFFACGPPVLTIGLYFCLWHALRHIVRLELLDPYGAALLTQGQLVKAGQRFAGQAAPITAIALVVLALAYVHLPSATGSAEGQLGPYLVLISALTVPHIAIVTYMDRRQNV